MQGVARPNLLAQELAAARIPLCAITETHLPGCGCMELDDQSGYNLYFLERLTLLQEVLV